MPTENQVHPLYEVAADIDGRSGSVSGDREHEITGATLRPDGTVRFRLWGPSVKMVRLVIDDDDVPMLPTKEGWHEVTHAAHVGSAYCFKLPDGRCVPDPRSRAQLDDVGGLSLVVDPSSYAWTSNRWMGRPWHEAVIYELHAGLMGGFSKIREELPRLCALVVTVIELMPVSDFPGDRNWGYDGVLPFAPDRSYGTPDELKAMVDEAHTLGLSVILDVVYNHFGPDGNFLHTYAEEFFRDDIKTPWGAAIDFRQPQVKQFFMDNALYWINEFRFDGLRFDAVHAITDPTFLDELALHVRAGVAPRRHVHLVLEHEGNAASLLGDGKFDAQWADDFHHCVHVLLTGGVEGYYEDFQEATKLLARCLAEGFVSQGQVSPHAGKARGEPSAHLPPTACVMCLQNHDQIGNRALGERLPALSEPDHLRAATALLLLSPFVPLIFMGDEWGADRPFLFFTSHNEELAQLIRDGRRDEFKHFAAFKDVSRRDHIPDPNARSTFEVCGIDESDPAMERLYRDLLAMRHEHVVPGIPGARSAGVDVHGPGAMTARWTLGTGDELTIEVNLGSQTVPLHLTGKPFFSTVAEGSVKLPPGNLVASIARSAP